MLPEQVHGPGRWPGAAPEWGGAAAARSRAWHLGYLILVAGASGCTASGCTPAPVATVGGTVAKAAGAAVAAVGL